ELATGLGVPDGRGGGGRGRRDVGCGGFGRGGVGGGRAGILGGRGTWQRGQGEQCDGKAGDRQRSRHGRVRNPWVAVWLLYRDRRRRRGISQSGQYSPRPLDCYRVVSRARGACGRTRRPPASCRRWSPRALRTRPDSVGQEAPYPTAP